MNRKNVRMIERRGRARFLLEPSKPIGVRQKLLRKELHRNVAAQALVARSVDFAHAALGKLLEHAVRSEVAASHGAFSASCTPCERQSSRTRTPSQSSV